jgi:hypothetical protein
MKKGRLGERERKESKKGRKAVRGESKKGRKDARRQLRMKNSERKERKWEGSER